MKKFDFDTLRQLYKSIFYHWWLYANTESNMHVENFMELGLNVIDVNKKKKTVVNWTNLVRIEPNNEGFSYYIDSFMLIVYMIVNNSNPPSIFIKA